nr:AEC family transporter [Halomarina oriensis]
MVSIFTSAIAPVVAIAAVGFLLGRVRGLNVDPLNTVVVYVFAPALVFHSLLTTDIGGETLLSLGVAIVCFFVAMTLLVEVVVRVVGIDEPLRSASVLTSVYPNCGNYGIPLSAFAFGDVGRATAVLYLAVQSLIIYTHGVFVAARSGGDVGRSALRQVFTIPLVYAVALAILVRAVGLTPPDGGTLLSTLELVGNAAIPLMLVMLGSQLVGVDVRSSLGIVSLSTGLKLLVAPIVAIGVAIGLQTVGLGVDGTVGAVFVLESATPAAVTPLILLVEFGDEDAETAAEFASSVVLVSTLLSVVTVTVLVSVLQSGTLL